MRCDTLIRAAVSSTAPNTRMTDRIDRIAFRTGPIPSRRDRMNQSEGERQRAAEGGNADRRKRIERQRTVAGRDRENGREATTSWRIEHGQAEDPACKDRPQIAQAFLRKQDDCGAEINRKRR